MASSVTVKVIHYSVSQSMKTSQKSKRAVSKIMNYIWKMQLNKLHDESLVLASNPLEYLGQSRDLVQLNVTVLS